MQTEFPNVLNVLLQGISKIAEKDIKNYAIAATKDGHAIIEQIKPNLQNWALMLENRQLSKADFTDLVLGQKEEIEMVALKQAGLAEVSVDQFKNDVFGLINSTILALVP